MRKQETLRNLIKQRSNGLKCRGKIDPDALLAAILYCESKMGKKLDPRPEPAYLPNGSHFNNEAVRDAFKEYGEAAAFSYGPWQVPYISAKQLGFKGEPSELAEPEMNIMFAIQYLNQKILNRGICTISQIAEFYSQNYIDRRAPHTYIRRFIQAYNGKGKEWLDGKDI